MTPNERTQILTVSTITGPMFDNVYRTAWGLADTSRSVFHSMGKPLFVDGSKPYAQQLATLLSETLQQEYLGEWPEYDRVFSAISAFIGEDGAKDISDFVIRRWQYIHTQEAIDRAKAWTAGRNILAEIDRISPDPLYRYFHKATKTLDEATDAAFLYGFEMGLAAAREGAQP